MTIATLSGVPLSDNAYWPDEYTWSPVAQQTTRALDGTLIVEESARQKGRPITLRGLWLTRETIEQLKALEGQAGQQMTLTLPDESTRQVVFRRDSGDTAVAAEPLVPEATPSTDTLYETTIRLTEV